MRLHTAPSASMRTPEQVHEAEHLCRVQLDRRDQAKQDLKGLEETVVSYTSRRGSLERFLGFSCSTCTDLNSLLLLTGQRAADAPQPQKTVCPRPGHPSQEGKHELAPAVVSLP